MHCANIPVRLAFVCLPAQLPPTWFLRLREPSPWPRARSSGRAAWRSRRRPAWRPLFAFEFLTPEAGSATKSRFTGSCGFSRNPNGLLVSTLKEWVSRSVRQVLYFGVVGGGLRDGDGVARHGGDRALEDLHGALDCLRMFYFDIKIRIGVETKSPRECLQALLSVVGASFQCRNNNPKS